MNQAGTIKIVRVSVYVPCLAKTWRQRQLINLHGTPNANFNIRISSAQVTGAPAAVYTDTVTLLISPS
ncbi:hypothetical protein [Legionella birminghamensis]|uniref:hypothetical protein n=1 Tax=Legionella birminghamensis TaxID=28083 RepID=UPI0010412270|nr:hypothetical protein [Legionella birminghamensis]